MPRKVTMILAMGLLIGSLGLGGCALSQYGGKEVMYDASSAFGRMLIVDTNDHKNSDGSALRYL